MQPFLLQPTLLHHVFFKQPTSRDKWKFTAFAVNFQSGFPGSCREKTTTIQKNVRWKCKTEQVSATLEQIQSECVRRIYSI